MKRQTEASAIGLHKNCPSCGGLLRYDIKYKKLVCTSCQSGFPLTIYPDPEADASEMEVVEYHCPQCGGNLHTTNTNIVSRCSFCGADVVFQERIARTRRPDKIIPFSITREECESRYREYMGGHLKKDQPLKFQPVYIPFYWYRETFSGAMNAQYIETEKFSDYDSITTYEQAFNTDVTVEGEMECASSQFESETANQLELHVKNVQPFSPAYLCGFYAEAPDLDSNLNESKLDSHACQLLKDRLGSMLAKTISSISLPSKQSDTAELMLVPVWLLAESKGHRVMYSVVSGVDGRVICDKPVSDINILTRSLFISACLFVVIMLLNSVLILQPNVVLGLCALLASCGYYCITTHVARHNQNRITDEKRKETKRCSVLTSFTPIKSISICAYALKILTPMIALTFGLLLVPSLNTESLPYIFVCIPIALFFLIKKSIAVCVKAKKHEFALDKRGTITEWFWLFGTWPLLAAILLMQIVSILLGANSAAAFLVSDRSLFMPAICLYSAITLIIYPKKGNSDKTDRFLCLLEILILAASGVLQTLTPLKWVQHGMSIVILIPLLLSMIRINRRHNEFISRPVPFFQDKEAMK